MKLNEKSQVTIDMSMLVKIVITTAAVVVPFTTIWLDVQTLKKNDEVKAQKLERISEQITDLRDDLHRVVIEGPTAFHSQPVLANP